MTTTIALLVTDANREAVEFAINEATPEFTVEFSRGCATINPTMTWEEPVTHWYANASAVPDEVATAWQALAPSLTGMVLFLAINAVNAAAWAETNLASQGLQFVPFPPA